MRYLTAFTKGLLRPEDTHVSQIKTILFDGLEDSRANVSEVDFNRLKEEVNNYVKAPHNMDELDKVIETYSPGVSLNL